MTATEDPVVLWFDSMLVSEDTVRFGGDQAGGTGSSAHILITNLVIFVRRQWRKVVTLRQPLQADVAWQELLSRQDSVHSD